MDMSQSHIFRPTAEEPEWESPLHRALVIRTKRAFGEYLGAIDQPTYIIAFDGDAKTEIPIVDVKTPKEVLKEISPIFPIHGRGERVDSDDERFTWVEPAVGIGVSYNRDHRWAYICDKQSDQSIVVSDITIERILAGDVPLEVYAAHDDTTVIHLG